MKLVYGFLALLGGCATSALTYYKPAYVVRDAPDDGRMYLELQNTTGKTLCLDEASWPNSEGEIDSASKRVSINVNGTSFPMKSIDTGYCPGCGAKVKPGGKLTGFVKYEYFNIPREYIYSKKELIFIPVASTCK